MISPLQIISRFFLFSDFFILFLSFCLFVFYLVECYIPFWVGTVFKGALRWSLSKCKVRLHHATAWCLPGIWPCGNCQTFGNKSHKTKEKPREDVWRFVKHWDCRWRRYGLNHWDNLEHSSSSVHLNTFKWNTTSWS